MSDPTPVDPPAPVAMPAVAPAAPPPVEPSDLQLIRFFAVSAAARTAASSLGKAAEVGVRFTDLPGDYRFAVEGGKPRLAKGKAKEPDFDLELAPGAVKAICARPDDDVGELGIVFFQQMIAKEPGNKVRVKLHSGLLRLTMRGWLGVLAHGGSKVVGWLAQKGLKGPGAVASAISRLRK